MSHSWRIGRIAILWSWVLLVPAVAGAKNWHRLQPLGTPPSSRATSAAAFDAKRGRMIMLGGNESGFIRGDAWSLALNGRARWTKLEPTGGPPIGWRHSAVFDPAGDRVLVFGGVVTSGDAFRDTNQTWVLSFAGGDSWDDPAIGGDLPPARDSHTAIYDPVRERMIVFGGGGPDGLLGDVWALSLKGGLAWTRLVTSGPAPAPRGQHTAIYDPVHDRMLVFGGATFGGQLLDDVWALSLEGPPAWTRLAPAGAPPSPRAAHRAIYEAERGRMLVLGGYQGGADPFASDVWELSLGDAPVWTQVPLAGTTPGGRFAPALALNRPDDEVVLVGGQELRAGAKNPALSETWGLVLGDEPDVPRTTFSISPNPMRGANGSLAFYLPISGEVSLDVVDVTGRRVWTQEFGEHDAGWHVARIGDSLAPGVYWLRAQVDGQRLATRLVVLR